MLPLLLALASAGAFPYQALTTAGCVTPQWPREALRYEIEGSTTLQFQLALDGTVQQARVQQGSGWTILDQAAMQGLARCRFKPGLAEAREGAWFPLRYQWTLEGPAPLRPVLVAGSCQASPHIARYDDLDLHADGRAGIRVRFLVGADGRAHHIVPEPGRFAAPVVRDAVAWLQTCRFGISAKASGERTDTSFGTVVLR